MPILKTLAKAMKQEKESFRLPRSVQEAIPIRRIWPDGIFQVGNRFSKAFSFTDINYSIASKDDKTAMFLDYCDLLNALDSGASAKITIHNRRLDKAQFERSLLLPMREDSLDHFRREYNEMLLSKVTGSNNSVVQERCLTLTVASGTSTKPVPISPVSERISSAICPGSPPRGGNWTPLPDCGCSGIFSRVRRLHRLILI